MSKFYNVKQENMIIFNIKFVININEDLQYILFFLKQKKNSINNNKSYSNICLKYNMF